jgi:hypothetical protein
VVSLAESPERSTRYRCALVVWRRSAVALVLIGTQIQPLSLAAMVNRLPAALSFDQTRADRRPSVAVMPFATMSGDQSYFADGLTEDVTTALARNSDLGGHSHVHASLS